MKLQVKRNHKQKRWLSVVLLLSLLVIIGILVFLNTRDDLVFASFKRFFLPHEAIRPTLTPSEIGFANSATGITFAYTSDWTRTGVSAQANLNGILGVPLVGFIPKELSQNGPTKAFVEAIVWLNPGNLSLQDYKQQYSVKTTLGSCDLPQCRNIVVIPLKNKFLQLESSGSSESVAYAQKEKILLKEIMSTVKETE